MFYGLGSMLGAGIYGLIGDTAKVMGNTVWAGFVTAMVAALLTGLSYASLGSRYPKAGGAAYITGRATRSPVVSMAVGLAVMMSGLTSMATGLQKIAEKLLDLGGPALTSKLLAIGIAAAIGLVIFRGIRESVGLNTLCTIIEAGGLLFIIIVGCRYWGSVNYLEVPPAAVSMSGCDDKGLTAALLMQGAILTFFSFIGFEDILNVSEEVKNPRRNVPFGLVAAMLAATVIYVCVAVTAVSVLGWERLAQSKHPLDDVAREAAPWFTGIGSVYFYVTIFAIGNTALLNYLMGSRLLYGMGSQRLLPAALSRVHPQRRTPHVAIAVLLGIVSVLILSGDVRAMAEATVLLLLAVFAVMNFSLLALQRRPGEARGLVCLAFFGRRLYAAFENEALRTAPLIALAIFSAGLALGWLRRGKCPAM
jgi:basic amino acid/polyamine antiporter, APA family